MLPYLAQGANVSLEDGAVLGTLLSNVKVKSELGPALRRYEVLRKQRGQTIAAETFQQVRHLFTKVKHWFLPVNKQNIIARSMAYAKWYTPGTKGHHLTTRNTAC